MATTTNRKVSRVTETAWPNGLGVMIRDCNRSSACVAEVMRNPDGTHNVQISRRGREWKYARGVVAATAYGAFEAVYCCPGNLVEAPR